MGFLPRITRCPCCSTLSLVKIDKTTQDNPFKNLSDWIIRKRFSCRKCKELLGLFFHRSNSEERVIWLNMIECENRYYDKLNVLEKRKNKTPPWPARIEGARRGGLGGRPERQTEPIVMEKRTHTKKHEIFVKI